MYLFIIHNLKGYKKSQQPSRHFSSFQVLYDPATFILILLVTSSASSREIFCYVYLKKWVWKLVSQFLPVRWKWKGAFHSRGGYHWPCIHQTCQWAFKQTRSDLTKKTVHKIKYLRLACTPSQINYCLAQCNNTVNTHYSSSACRRA